MKIQWISLGLLICGAAAMGADDASPATQPTTQPSERSMSAEQMLSRMLKPSRDVSRPLAATRDGLPLDKSSGRGAVAPNAPTVTVLREGTFIVDRIGRLTRSNDGSQSEFTFESDGQTMKDPPVIILPNLKLSTMEQANGIANRDLRFRVTGMVTEYHGRNYILLEKVVVVPDVTQQF